MRFGGGMGEVIPLMRMLVTASIRLQWRRSTRRLKCRSKSAPMMAWLTSAIVKIQGNEHRRPRLRVKDRGP